MLETSKNSSLVAETRHQIICLNTGKIYSSIVAVAKDVGCSSSNIARALEKPTRKAKGLSFAYHKKAKQKNMPKTKKTCATFEARKRPIQCIETGIVYDSTLAAAKAHKTNRASIRFQINGKIKTVKGFTFKRIEKTNVK